MNSAKKQSAISIVGQSYSARSIFTISIMAMVLGLVGFLIANGVEASFESPPAATSAERNAEAVANELRTVSTVSRWYYPKPFLSQRQLVTYRFSLTPTGNLTSGSATVTLPSFLRYDGHDHAGFSYVTVSGSGQNVSISFNAGTTNGFNSWEARIYVRVLPLEQYPDVAPTGEVRCTGSTSGPGGGGSFNIISPTGLAYTKSKWSRIGTGPVSPGDELTFKIETKAFAHSPLTVSVLSFKAPPNTEFVPNSITGIDGGIVTHPFPDHYTIDWGAGGGDHTVTYRLRVKPDTPSSVTSIMHLHGGFGYYPSYSWDTDDTLGMLEFLEPKNLTIPLVHTGVDLTINIPDKRFEVGDQFPASVTVKSSSNQLRTITFTDPLLKERPYTGGAENLILEIDPQKAAPFDLTSANPSRTFTVPVKVNKRGVTEVVSSLSFTGPGGIQGTKTVVKKVSAPPLDVNVEVTPKQTVFNQTPAAKKTERCRVLEAASPIKIDPDTGAQVREINNCIEIVVKVKNSSERTITNVNIPDADNPLKLINEINPKFLGEPVKEIEHVFPASPVTLAAGAEATWIWRMNAFDGPGFLEFEPTVFGVDSGQEVGGHGNEDFDIVKNPLLKWGMRPTGGRTSYKSGDGVRSDGYIENVTGGDNEQDENKGKTLRVMVYQLPKENLGGGFVFPAEYGGQSPIDYEIFELPAEGPLKKQLIRNVFRSSRTNESSRGIAGFGVRLWVVEDDGKLSEATGQAELDDEGYTDEFQVSFLPEPPIINRETEACLKEYQPIVCSFNEAFAGEFADGMVGLYQFGLDAADEIGETGPRVIAYNLKGMQMYWDALKGNPEAEKYIIDEMYAKYEILYDLGVLGKDVAKQAPGAFAETVFGGMGKFFQAVENGDMDEVQRQTGHFFGANPDLLLEPLVVAGSAMRLSRAMKATRGGIADNAVAAAAREKRAAQAATQKERLAAAKLDPNETDLSKALKSGDIIDEPTMIDVFGVDQKTLDRIDEIAKKFGIIMTFRSRSKISQTLLNLKQAWPKPQALKHKTVSPIDRDYFGYRADAEGILEIVEPPAGLRDIPVDDENALESAMIAYMKQMDDARPELKANKALRKEVHDRMKTRVKEWQKYSKKELGLDPFVPNGDDIQVGVSFEANMQWARDKSGDVGPKEFRKVHREQIESVIDPATGESKRVWTIKIDGPGGQPPKPVTGDIDFLGFLDENGHPILDDDKRMAIYEAMYQAQLMEHGESMTFRMDDVRKEYLECCVEGAEGMMTVGPWKGPPRVGRFVNNLSVMKGFNEKFKRVRRIFNPTDKNGDVIFDEHGKPKVITVRMEDPIGEYSLINGIPLMDNFDKVWTARFAPLLWEQVYESYKNTFKYYFPHLLGIALFDLEGDNLYARTPENTLIYRRGGPILQLEPVAPMDLRRPKQLRIWTAEAGWRNVTRDEALAAGQVGVPDIAPFSILRANAAGGSDKLEIESLAQMEATGDFFQSGDAIVLDPGGARQETAVILSLNPLTLTAPLQFDHNVGEMIAWIEAPTGSSVKVSGRVLSDAGRGLGNAIVSITGPENFSRTVTTNALGFYSFSDLPGGRKYTFNVRSKRFRFTQREIMVSSDLSDVDFTGLE